MAERIHGPAFRSPEGDIYGDPIPASHWSVAENIKALLHDGTLRILKEWEDGFLTDTGRFVGREEAKRIAEAAGQIVNPISGSSELFSEELWTHTEA